MGRKLACHPKRKQAVTSSGDEKAAIANPP